MKTGYVQSGDIRIFYRDLGAGPPLLLLHGGWATGRINWGNQYDALSRHFRVLSPDHRGHGRTDNPSGRFESYAHLADDIARFLEQLELPEPPIVMGHSSGALISLHLSVHHPELVAKQILIGIHPHIGVSETFKAGMREFFFTDDHTRPPREWAYIRNAPTNAFALWWAHRKTPWYRLLQQAWPMWISPLALTEDDYRGISCPTLIVNGTCDEFGSPDDTRDLHRLIPGSDLVLLPDEDHLFVIDKPDLLRRTIAPFLFPAGPPPALSTVERP